MKIELKNIKIINFKGIKNLAIDFLDQTTIEGENATFKSTVFDAVLWLLFGKNADDKKDFEIKPLDKFNNPLPKLENSVEGDLFIDDKKSILKRTQREKWVKPHGESEYAFTGNETVYEINGVPKKQGEYNDFINNLVQEDLFKLITSTTYFNNLHWEKRREIIINLAGAIKDQDVVDKMSNVEQGDIILAILNEGKSMNDAKKEINAEIKRIKDELKLIPSRIDEAQRDKPEVADFATLKKQLTGKESEIIKIDGQLQDKSKAVKAFYEYKAEKQAKLGQLKTNVTSMESSHNADYENEKRRIEISIMEFVNTRVMSSTFDTTAYEQSILKVEEQNVNLRQTWHKINDSVFEFDPLEGICPICKQDLPNTEKVKQKFPENFNLNKIKVLNELKTKGDENNAVIKGIKINIDELILENKGISKKIDEDEKEIEKLQKQLDSLVVKPLDSKEYNELKANISAKETEINTMVGIDNPIELQGQKADLKAEIDQLNIKLMDADRIESIEKRVEELALDEKIKSQAIADLEKTEFAIQNFVKIKMEYIENKVNSMFEIVKFKMFETQINGGQKEVCETLVNGVPFNSDLNTGHKVLAGLDIIKTFSKHYDMYAPVFVDNAESVTEPFPAMDSQMVYLYAKKGVKKLVIS